MSIDMLRDALLWCAVINYGVLLVWFLFFILAHDFMHRLHGLSYAQIADHFDISVSAIEKHIATAMAALGPHMHRELQRK